MNETELKQCPFCKGQSVGYNSLVITDKGHVLFLKCPDCKTNFRVLRHIYNQRPIEDTLRATLAHAVEQMNIAIFCCPDKRWKEAEDLRAELAAARARADAAEAVVAEWLRGNDTYALAFALDVLAKSKK
jgi:uncharacterized protein YbaR (Trm112 family)